MRSKTQTSGFAQVVVMAVAALIVITIGVFLLLNRDHTASAPGKQNTSSTKSLSGYCVGQTFTMGSSGHCVSDIQAMTNYMEDSGLTQCPFVGADTLSVDGVYDAKTGAQIRAVQQWAVCYAHQEGFTTNIESTGTVDRATWGELCTYGYTNPSRNGATGAAASVAAGRDAGCAQLHS